MKAYDFVHLVLYAVGGRLHGRTKLQKTVYFAGAITGDLADLGYRAHFYGPYSSDVAAAIEELRGLGFLRQTVTAGGAVDQRGFEVARYDYELTDEGRTVAEEKCRHNPEEWSRINEAMNRMVRARDEDYVKLSVAAKKHFLRQHSPATSSEELVRQTPDYGWQVSVEQFNEADTILNSMDLP